METQKTQFGARFAGLYFVAQGILVALWWYMMLGDQSFAELFFSSSYRFERFRDLFFSADMFVLAPLSVLAGILCLRRATFAPYIAYAAAGASWYACLMELAINAPIGKLPLADGSMILCALGSTFAAWRSTAD